MINCRCFTLRGCLGDTHKPKKMVELNNCLRTRPNVNRKISLDKTQQNIIFQKKSYVSSLSLCGNAQLVITNQIQPQIFHFFYTKYSHISFQRNNFPLKITDCLLRLFQLESPLCHLLIIRTGLTNVFANIFARVLGLLFFLI